MEERYQNLLQEIDSALNKVSLNEKDRQDLERFKDAIESYPEEILSFYYELNSDIRYDDHGVSIDDIPSYVDVITHITLPSRVDKDNFVKVKKWLDDHNITINEQFKSFYVTIIKGQSILRRLRAYK